MSGVLMKTEFIRLSQKGFTLIELMIVVGIIGILVSIAAPNFARYQSKARQSEAKIALAAVYVGEKAFYSEYSAYIGSMDAIGYAPEGQRRFYLVGWSAVQTVPPNGYDGVLTNANWTPVNNAFGSCTGTPALDGAMSGDVQTFVAAAIGCVRQGAANDYWRIDNAKILANNNIGL